MTTDDKTEIHVLEMINKVVVGMLIESEKLSERRRDMLDYFLQCYNKNCMTITGLDVNKLMYLAKE